MKKLTYFIFFIQIIAASAQNLSGQWKGVLTQSGKADTFYYEINISHKDQSITGTSYSRAPVGRDSARFVITGFWDGKELVLQELEQTMPKNGGWCSEVHHATMVE
ncbi:MAG: hypothetical protein IPJ74_12765 [Saprospiraceae bacterium]|nr:hypothetical protein [Saprospiraceae bacterium]